MTAILYSSMRSRAASFDNTANSIQCKILTYLEVSDVENFRLVSKSMMLRAEFAWEGRFKRDFGFEPSLHRPSYKEYVERRASVYISAMFVKMSNGTYVPKITKISPSTSKPSSTFEKSPEALQILILEHLNPRELSPLQLVSKSVNALANNNRLLKKMFERSFPKENSSLPIPFKIRFFLISKKQNITEGDPLVSHLQQPDLTMVSNAFGHVMLGFKNGRVEAWKKDGKADKFKNVKNGIIPNFPEDTRNFHIRNGLAYVVTPTAVHQLDFSLSDNEKRAQLNLFRSGPARIRELRIEGFEELANNFERAFFDDRIEELKKCLLELPKEVVHAIFCKIFKVINPNTVADDAFYEMNIQSCTPRMIAEALRLVVEDIKLDVLDIVAVMPPESSSSSLTVNTSGAEATSLSQGDSSGLEGKSDV